MQSGELQRSDADLGWITPCTNLTVTIQAHLDVTVLQAGAGLQSQLFGTCRSVTPPALSFLGGPLADPMLRGWTYLP